MTYDSSCGLVRPRLYPFYFIQSALQHLFCLERKHAPMTSDCRERGMDLVPVTGSIYTTIKQNTQKTDTETAVTVQ